MTSEAPMSSPANSLSCLLGCPVVMDTAGPAVYLGVLSEILHDGYWLTDADLRDQSEGGHITKEQYVCEARRLGIHPNRRRIFVPIHVVISVSALDDVIVD